MEYEVLDYVPEIPEEFRRNNKWSGIIEEFRCNEENKTIIFKLKNPKEYKTAMNSIRAYISKHKIPITTYGRMAQLTIYLIKA